MHKNYKMENKELEREFDHAHLLISENNLHRLKQSIEQLPSLLSCHALLRFAVLHSRYDICDMLLMAGMDANAANHLGRTALFCNANSSGSTDMADLLVLHGADVNAVDSYGISIMQIHCELSGTEQVKRLIHHGANVNFESPSEGVTCLSLSITNRNTELFWVLLKAGALIENDTRAFECACVSRSRYYYYRLELLRTVIAFCSIKCIPRMGISSKLPLLSMDIIRKLLVEFL